MFLIECGNPTLVIHSIFGLAIIIAANIPQSVAPMTILSSVVEPASKQVIQCVVIFSRLLKNGFNPTGTSSSRTRCLSRISPENSRDGIFFPVASRAMRLSSNLAGMRMMSIGHSAGWHDLCSRFPFSPLETVNAQQTEDNMRRSSRAIFACR